MLIVNIAQIEVPKEEDQLRAFENQSSYTELKASIKKDGILRPLIVVASGKHYRIIDGLRRYNAALVCNLPQIPVEVVNTRN